MARSSTYKHIPTVGSTAEAISFTAIAKSVTLKVEPCGTPFSGYLSDENVFPTLTLNVLPDRKEDTPFMEFLQDTITPGHVVGKIKEHCYCMFSFSNSCIMCSR
ncbi:hypothetical protein JTB14_036976 [Gonioctena quinquepunctata]|nr:hypothetical protein JTB14_036976 [Gonioctena quinquepunctata]